MATVMDRRTEDRFLASFTVGDDCWEWTGGKRPNGYGRFWIEGKRPGAHRAAFEYWNNPIPRDLQINHLCENKGCVRPDHLEAVSARENILYSDTPAKRNASKMKCPAGHPYDEQNTYRPGDGRRRYCLTCHREKGKLRARSYRAAARLRR